MPRKIIRLLEVLNEPDAFRQFIKLRNRFSISSFHINRMISNYQPIFHTVIDAGANVGQFALAAAQRFPMADIHCFEPVPDVCEILKKNTKKISKIHIYNCAVGDISGKIKFHRNDYTPASSAMAIQGDMKEHNRANCQTQHTKTIEVDVFKIDDLVSTFSINVKKPVLLKLDVQGYEKKTIQGAVKTLESIDYIVLEATFVKLYENQPLFDELHEMLHNINFEFIAPLDVNVGINKSIVEMDILYKRKNL
ncbi:MAG: Methyltransferase FkbM family [Candidatus Uhrbacteria bacterium GW2011_GWF2_39_13]|uniref:Methyltransferase FkbM family n=1 Tax=Candidatus Uhrbacteria bacterium GW2011_GWF2_39_13 TaxID=1618995 RepID=A0A0G0MLH8_9BACT|nr:MAG: Methyltransferase FkbM family [Candidatus Uhrbacteria bacterium GW2011_GWF2_39_13]